MLTINPEKVMGGKLMRHGTEVSSTARCIFKEKITDTHSWGLDSKTLPRIRTKEQELP
jgi:hypothetical protein